MSDLTIKTEDEINQDLKDNMPNYQATTGFPIGDFFVAIAMVLETLWNKLLYVFGLLDITNYTGDDLARKCKQDRNIIKKLAQPSSGYVTINGDFALLVGDKFNTEGGLIFQVTTATEDVNGTASVPVECTTKGTITNVAANTITKMPITLQGVTSVTNPDAFINGYDDESDASLLQRYQDDVAMPITSGNQYHYRKWALEITGVGNVRIIPCWAGANTVKAILIDSNSQPASNDLISKVDTYIDPAPKGTGAGQAPCGAYLTTVSATALNIIITANIVYLAGMVKADVDSAIAANITNYLKSIAFNQSYVSYAKIGDLILNTEGVEDYNSLKVNNGTANVAILDTQVAILGTTTFTKVS